ncbi:pectate lyase, partial [Alteromonadaceae bacterium Bs31]
MYKKLLSSFAVALALSSITTSALAANGPLSIYDKAPGWASMNGGTTGGGTDLSKAVTVTNMSALKSAVSGSSKKIVLVEPGNYDGTLSPGANTTIIGTAPGVRISGNISVSGSDKKNIIVRNIAVRGKPCGSNDACKSGSDGVYIGNGATNIWFDHVDVSDGQDGNFDVTRSGDFVTCSWCKFYYTYDKDHRLSNLIAGSDNETESRGKLNITYMNSMWGDRVNSRQPRGRFGKIHMLNNYHKNSGSLHGVGKEMALIAENSYYDVPGKDVFFSMGSPKGWKGSGNKGSAKNLNATSGSTFTIPYSYSKMSADEAKAAVLSSDCGAGNTCLFDHDGTGSSSSSSSSSSS